jgi:hypothetical protein
VAALRHGRSDETPGGLAHTAMRTHDPSTPERDNCGMQAVRKPAENETQYADASAVSALASVVIRAPA